MVGSAGRSPIQVTLELVTLVMVGSAVGLRIFTPKITDAEVHPNWVHISICDVIM